MTKQKPSAIADWNPIPEDIRGLDLMEIAWRDCLLWAVGFAPVLIQFEGQTGKRLDISSVGINALIDQATGYNRSEMRRFIEWFNENVWGGVE